MEAIIMKVKKCLSTILAGMMSVSLWGSLSVGAEEEKIYTFSELLEMSEEEFLALDETANSCYYDMKSIPEGEARAIYGINNMQGSSNVPDYEALKVMYSDYVGLRGVFDCTVKSSDKEYIPYETEKCIQYLLGDSVEYTVKSPLMSGSSYFDWRLEVSITDFKLKFSEITDEDILYLAKFEYCIMQADSNLLYLSPYVDIFSHASNYGEANGDDKLTAGDAAYIAKKLAEQKADELPETADFNGDGKITALDCAEIARFLAAKALARAEGMFVEQQ